MKIHRKALLIIDMQKGSFIPATARYDTPGVVSRINALARKFRTADQPVIFIQHDGSAMGNFMPQTEAWELLDELETLADDLYIGKYANDCFYHSALKQTLDELGITELWITGCATDFCVASTVQSALTQDYHISVIGDAHTTADRPGLTAKQLIDHYNWVWSDMLPTQGSIRVVASEQMLSLGE